MGQTPDAPLPGRDADGLAHAPRRVRLAHDPVAALGQVAVSPGSVVVATAPARVRHALRELGHVVRMQQGGELSAVAPDAVTVWSTTSLASPEATSHLGDAVQVFVIDPSGSDPLGPGFESIWLTMAAVRSPVVICISETDPQRRRRIGAVLGAPSQVPTSGTFDIEGAAVELGVVEDRHLLVERAVIVGRDGARLSHLARRMSSRSRLDVDTVMAGPRRKDPLPAPLVVLDGLPGSAAAVARAMRLVTEGGRLVISPGRQWRRPAPRSELVPAAVEAALRAATGRRQPLLRLSSHLMNGFGRLGGVAVGALVAMGLLEGTADSVRLDGPVERARARFADLGSSRRLHRELAAERLWDATTTPCPWCAIRADIGDTGAATHDCALRR